MIARLIGEFAGPVAGLILSRIIGPIPTIAISLVGILGIMAAHHSVDIAGLDEPVAYAPNPEVARKGGSISGTLSVNTIATSSGGGVTITAPYPVMSTGTTAWTTATLNAVGLPANCVVSPTNGGGIAVCGSTALPR